MEGAAAVCQLAAVACMLCVSAVPLNSAWFMLELAEYGVLRAQGLRILDDLSAMTAMQFQNWIQ